MHHKSCSLSVSQVDNYHHTYVLQQVQLDFFLRLEIMSNANVSFLYFAYCNFKPSLQG